MFCVCVCHWVQCSGKGVVFIYLQIRHRCSSQFVPPASLPPSSLFLLPLSVSVSTESLDTRRWADVLGVEYDIVVMPIVLWFKCCYLV